MRPKPFAGNNKTPFILLGATFLLGLSLSHVLTCQKAKKSKLLARAAIVHALLEFLNLKINVEDDWKENLGDVEGCKMKLI